MQGGGVGGLPEHLEQATVHVQLSLSTDHLPLATTHPKINFSQSKHLFVGQG